MRPPIVPKVSIVMPVKNAEAWLAECLYSIEAQTLKDWELVAVDDGSDDRSFEMLSNYAQREPRISALRSRGSGISDALQQARENAKAPFITRMDADDLMPPKKLEWMLAEALNDPQKVVTGRVQYFHKSDLISAGYRAYEGWLNERVTCMDHSKWRYRECCIAGANWLCHRSLLPSRLDDLHYPEDYDLVFYWLQQNIEFSAVNEVTHLWREHADRTSRNHEHYSQHSFFELKLGRFLDLDDDLKRPLVVLGKGSKAKLAGRILEEAGRRFQSMDEKNAADLEPMKNPLVLAAVFPPEKQRMALAQWLESLDLAMGHDWWWL